MDIMGCGTLCNVTSRGQSVLSTIAAAMFDGGKDDFKELRGFPTATANEEIQEAPDYDTSTCPLEVKLCNVPHPFGIHLEVFSLPSA